MNEDEWLTSNDAVRMLHVIQQSSLSDRKVRLLNATICRRFWNYLPEASQTILLESELLADGRLPLGSNDFELCWRELCGRANGAVAPFDRQYPMKQFPSTDVCIQRNAAAAVCYAVIPKELFGAVSYFWELEPAEKEPHSAIIRDVFGNPFRRITISPAWLSWHDGVVSRLAKAAYDERFLPTGTFDNARLLILSDALEEAGCTDEQILTHLRGGGEHYRGCWVIDLLLGKE
ncbi:MAG: hypothetical protein ACRELF_09700 [Gemmataceae bacterium]